MAELEFPHNAVILRFGTNTPYYPLTFSYGIFVDPSTRMLWTSLDAYLGHHMLVSPADRAEMIRAPNGYIAYRNLMAIAERSSSSDSNPVVSPTWERDRDDLLLHGLQMKYTQSSCLANLLLATGDRPIFDGSRREDSYWCVGSGKGANKHGILLEKIRASFFSGEIQMDIPKLRWR